MERKNDKELNDTQDKSIDIEKTKVFNYKEFEKNKITIETIKEETKKEKKKIIKKGVRRHCG